MNILSVTNALKEIKIIELDDEFQIDLISLITPALANSGASFTAESSGNDLRKLLDTEVDAMTRTELMQINLFPDHSSVVRFYTNVEKIQNAKEREQEYDDAIKGNFLSSLALFEIIAVFIVLAIYQITEPFRGKIPESKIIAGLDIIIANLSNLQ